MKILVAMDSFKGSLTSYETGRAVAEGIKRAEPNADVTVLPIADGGEGTVDALVYGNRGERVTVSATDPLGRIIECSYGITNNNTAVIEISACSGITLLKREELDPYNATTYGVGELIKDAVKRGCRKFIVGLGGSATNDGGAGMLQALGFELLNKDGKPIKRGALGLRDIVYIMSDKALKELKECSFLLACDVKNTLCGEKGCSIVFGPQKGATPDAVKQMDGWLYNYADIVKKKYPLSDMNAEGAGSAGGLGFAFMSFLSAKFSSGIETVLTELNFEDKVKNTDIVFTGEGRLDGQTAMGKAPIGVARTAKKYGKPVVALAGSVTPEATICNQNGIDAFFPVVRGVCTLDEALAKDNAYSNTADTAEQIYRLIKLKM